MRTIFLFGYDCYTADLTPVELDTLARVIEKSTRIESYYGVGVDPIILKLTEGKITRPQIELKILPGTPVQKPTESGAE